MNNIKLVILSLIIISILPTNSLGENFKVDQIFIPDKDTNSTYVKFIFAYNFSDYQSSESFKLYNWVNASNPSAYDYFTNENLSLTVNNDSDKNYYFIKFPRLYAPKESYAFVFQFNSTNFMRLNENNQKFEWSWGNWTYPIKVNYTVLLPPLYKIVYSQNFIEHTSKGKTLLTAVGESKANEYFAALAVIEKLEPPKLEIKKLLEKSKINTGDNLKVIVFIYNTGGSAAKKILVTDSFSGVFNIESGNRSWSGDIEAGKYQSYTYVLKATTSSKNEFLGNAVAVYTDLWENTYTDVSDDPTITIEKSQYIIELFGLRIPSLFDTLSLNLYMVFTGYLVLFTVFIIIRKDKHTWSSTDSMDKIIWSVIIGLINFIISFILFFIFAISISVVSSLLIKISNETISNVWYLTPLFSVPLTADIVDKSIIKVRTFSSMMMNNRKKYFLLSLVVITFIASLITMLVR